MAASIKDLKQRAQVSREMMERRSNRVRDAVKAVVDDPTFGVTMLAHKEEEVDQLANAVANKVAEVVNDPCTEFLDTCRSRQMKQSQIRHAVEILNSAFGLTTSADYDEKLKAVAEYMWNHQSMYDEFAIFDIGKN